MENLERELVFFNEVTYTEGSLISQIKELNFPAWFKKTFKVNIAPLFVATLVVGYFISFVLFILNSSFVYLGIIYKYVL